MPSVTPPEPPNPWRAFLGDVDGQLPQPIEIHCLGGFVSALYYDLPRPTNDLDYIEVVPHDATATLQDTAGADSPLAKKHRVHFQHVGVASLPESYKERLIELFPGRFRRLRLFALDPHDLALSKLTRNSPVDRDDVARLATAVPLDAKVLRRRYRRELRPIIIGDPEQHDRTLEMWIDAYLR
ncbi:MAG: hypothetical protein A3E31_11445 [Candidatus Rokubacteria bacterium RIFCSPHIGHO2_12_FULL_73_22]|nr:MAG: hypothetical protein A3E31_11445 [Candidatus Rokubacteria bacterium RIFCSPHIGHO2_12_FULL_73_22]